MVTLLYFASLRETLGCSREHVPLPAGTASVAMLLDYLRDRDPRWSEAFAPGKRYRVAGWASLEPQSGKPVNEVVGAYLRSEKTVRMRRRNHVVLKGVAGNPGFAE